MLAVLMSAQLMLAAAGLVLVAYSRWWGNHEGQVLAIVVAVIGVVQLVVGVAIGHRLGSARPGRA